MTSQAQIEASRANGKKSRGPKTPEGKRRSSQNARRHGLLAFPPALEGEAAAWFAESRLRLIEEWNPQNEIDRMLVDRLAHYNWCYFEALRTEKNLVEQVVNTQPEKHPEIAALAPGARLFHAMGEISKESNILESLRRYASQFDYRWFQTLRALRARRQEGSNRETNLTFKKQENAKRTQRASE